MGMILLHAIIPHKHHIEMTWEEHIYAHEYADDLIDFLGLGFHQDSNKNLENYSYTEQILLKKIYFVDFNSLTGFFNLEGNIVDVRKNLHTQAQLTNLSIDFILLSNGLRAPPDSGFYL